MVAGAATVVWALVVWRWEDPFTALYTLYEQHRLAQSYDRRARAFTGESPVRLVFAGHARTGSAHSAQATTAAEAKAVAADARRYRLESHEGDPLGRIVVPHLGLDMVFVDGTASSSLEHGPGRALQTFMPGENRLVYIAGHRTTFLAPFAHIDALRRGDSVRLELPYATFVYRVTGHVIVPATDLAVLRSGPSELLALQACHPRFFATHRYIVYARPVEVIPTASNAHAYATRWAQLIDPPSR